MRALSVVVLLIVVGLAGCADGTEPVGATVELGESQPFVDIVQNRSVLAQVEIHEAPEEGTVPDVDLDGEERGPHDGTLRYYGLGEVHDEWGRLVPAHVFRYDPLVYVVTSFSVSMSGIDIDGEYQVREYEYYFDAADGRFMGTTDVERGVRSFVEPSLRTPYAWGYAGNLMLSMVAYMKGELTEPVTYEFYDYTITQWMEPYRGERPLPGDCDMYLQNGTVEGPGVEAPDEPDPDPYRRIVCFDASMVPLWHWQGNKEDGSLSLERQGAGFSWQGPMGEVLAPEPFKASPMEEIPAPVPGIKPLYTPPSGIGDDWAGAVRDRVEALYTSVPYAQFQATNPPSYALDVSTGWPPMTFLPLVGGLLTGITEAAQFTETAWVDVQAEDERLFTFVHTLEVGETSRYVPDPNGYTRENGMFPYPTREELGDVVETDSVRGRVPELSPEQPRMVSWMVWPDFGSVYTPDAWWSVASHCFEEADDPRFLMFDGKDGHLLAAGAMASQPSGCSMGGFKSSLGGQEVTVYPANSDRPFPVILDADGDLATPMLPGMREAIGQRFTL